MPDIECLIIDNYENNIDQNLFYSIINNIKQANKYIVVNSKIPITKMKVDLKDLQSRLNSFVSFGINLPTDDLLRVMITKSFSDNQIKISNKNLEFIIKMTFMYHQIILKHIN